MIFCIGVILTYNCSGNTFEHALDFRLNFRFLEGRITLQYGDSKKSVLCPIVVACYSNDSDAKLILERAVFLGNIKIFEEKIQVCFCFYCYFGLVACNGRANSFSMLYFCGQLR